MTDCIENFKIINSFLSKPPKKFILGTISNENVYSFLNEYKETPLKNKQSDESSNICLHVDKHDINNSYSCPNVFHIPNLTDDFTELNDYLADIRYVDKNGEIHELPTTSFDISRDLDISPYGDLQTNDTVINKQIRHAYEIPSNRLLSDPNHSFIRNITEVICNQLYNGNSIELVLNKLNVYYKNGHFQTHIDTPVPNNVGSVVVYLNQYDFTGGNLILEGQKYSNGIIAFYSDVPHSVKEVKSGMRVTLTFYIKYFDQTFPYNNYLTIPLQYQTLLSQVITANPPNQNKLFGIILSQQYSLSEMNQQFIKGNDNYLTSFLHHHNYELFQMLPVLIRCEFIHIHYLDEFVNEDEEDNSTSGTLNVYQFNEDAIYNKQDNQYGQNICFYQFTPEEKLKNHLIKKHHQQYIEHTGNECQPAILDNFYYQTAILWK